MRIVLLVIGALVIGGFNGCGKPGDTLEVDRICSNLQTLTNNEIDTWLRTEISGHSSPRDGAPQKIDIHELPESVKTLFGNSPPLATLFLEPEKHSSYINLIWAHGRGAVGVQIGDASFKPSLNEQVFLVKQCEAGVFVYSPRRFP